MACADVERDKEVGGGGCRGRGERTARSKYCWTRFKYRVRAGLDRCWSGESGGDGGGCRMFLLWFGMGILTGCNCSCNIRISPGRQRRCLGCQQQGRMVDGSPRSCPEIPRTCRFITFVTGRRPAPCPAKPPLVSWTRGGPGNDAGQDVTEACLAVSVRVSSTAVPFPLQKRRHQREWLRKKHLLSGLVPMSTRKHPGCVSGTGTASRTSIPRGPPLPPKVLG